MKFHHRITVLFLILLSGLTGSVVAKDVRVTTVGFVQDNMANDWRRNQVQELEREFGKYPDVRFIYVDAKGSAARQVLETENMIEQGVDILISSPQDSQLMKPVLEKAYKRGTHVILLTRKISGNNYTTYISPDDYAIASKSAELIASHLNNKGNILMIRGLATATTAKLRTRGFLERIKDFPQLKLVKTINGNYLRQDTMREMERSLSQGIKFDAIFAQSDSMAAGARLVMKKYGIKPEDKIIVGIDYIKEAQTAIIAGEQTATFTYPSCSLQAAEVVRKLIDGEKVAKRIKVQSHMISKENVSLIHPIF